MAKVKDGVRIECYNEKHDEAFTLYIKYYSDDDEGYGVEVDDDTSGLGDWSFGHSAPAMRMAERLFDHIVEYAEKHKDFPSHMDDIYCTYCPHEPDDHMTDLHKIDDLVY